MKALTAKIATIQILIVLMSLTAGISMLSGCADETRPASEESTEMTEEERVQSLKAGMERANRAMEERRQNPPKDEIPLPNFNTGPGRPRPVGTNFYMMNDYQPGYLLCTYDVDKRRYDPAKEPRWFETALLQIRAKGRDLFPPVKWIAVIIVNRAEHKDVGTFEKSHKAGAIFSASEIFDLKHDLRKSIAQAQIDRHPFKYDKQQPTPGEQQRWLIVERHQSTAESPRP